jgi:hypothetical protein
MREHHAPLKIGEYMSAVPEKMKTLEKRFREAINESGIDSESNIPDYILAGYVYRSLMNFFALNNEMNSYLGGDHEPELSDAEVLRSAGHGTDEDYGGGDTRL